MKALITGQTFVEEVKQKLEQAGFEISNPTKHLEEADLIEALQGVDAYLLGGVEKATAKAIMSADNLKVIAFLGVGYESFVDVDAATKRGIAVTNTPRANTEAVAEMTIGMMLAMRRQIPYINAAAKAGQWREDIVSRNLQGNKLGIIGMGAIGQVVARRAHKGFDMEILYYSRTRKEHIEAEIGAQFVSLDALLTQSDFVSIHCTFTPETKGMIGAREIALMKEDAILINTARPWIVQPEALYEALVNRRIAGAAMDGYYIEPAPRPEEDPYKLLQLPDDVFIITTHLAYLTEDSIYTMCDMAANSVISILVKQEEYPYIVNPEYVTYKTGSPQHRCRGSLASSIT